MININLENNCFVYKKDNESKILLDCNDFMANKSRIPLVSPDIKSVLPFFLANLHQTYLNLFSEELVPNDGADYFLIDILLSAQLIKTSLPVKIVELGCTNGRLSYHLASVIGKFNTNSTLCCICDSIGNESGNFWLDMISLVENAPRLSMLASDYDDTNLCTNHFDIIIINGSVQISDADAMIKEAKRLVKTTGIIICYAWQQPQITNSMKQAFSSIDEYPTNTNVSVLLAHANDAIDECDKIIEWKNKALYDLSLAEAIIFASSTKRELLNIIQKMNQHADFATANNILDIKIKSLELKEKLLMKYVELE